MGCSPKMTYICHSNRVVRRPASARHGARRSSGQGSTAHNLRLDRGPVPVGSGRHRLGIGRTPLPFTLWLTACCLGNFALGQVTHGLYRADDPPGRIGARQLQRGDRFACRQQVVRVVAPKTAQVAPAVDGGFWQGPAGPLHVQLQVGSVYRFRVRNVPRLDDVELFPSVELIDSSSPPPGQALTHPLLVEFSQVDLEAAASGGLVIRVVFVEDPLNPVVPPGVETRGHQESLDVAPGEDPLQVADQLGRPVAIVRLGSVRPEYEQPDETFCFGFPPLEVVHVPWAGSGVPGDRLQGVFSPPGMAHAGGDGLEPPLGAACGSCCVPAEPAQRDEFVCDGGDDVPRARTGVEGVWRGLDARETVASFRGPDGEFHVVPSTQACVYSPRFVATRQLIRLDQTEDLARVGGMDSALPAADALSLIPMRAMSHAEQAEAKIVAAVPYGMHDLGPGRLVDQVTRLEEVSDRIIPLDHLEVLNTGLVQENQRALVAMAEENYIEWTVPESAEVVLDDQVALEQDGIRAANEGVLYDAPTGLKLRLVKAASRRDVPLGETVQFTIRFDNVGSEILNSVQIVDHLLSRLEYVPGSDRCSMPAQFDSEREEGETLRLRWKLQDPLPPGTGGRVTFQCRVR